MSHQKLPPSPLPEEACRDIVRALAESTSPSILTIGDSASQLPALAPDATWFHWNLCNLQPLATTAQQFEFAIVTPVLLHLPRSDATHILASLRDIYARKILLFLPLQEDESDWTLNELLGLGFRNLHEYDSPGGLHLLYYDVYDYKNTPDWFSAKNWANPERWNKDWW